jgi:hypothetical protein
MEFTLTHLRVLLAAIFLIAGSTLTGAALCLTGGALAASVESGASPDDRAASKIGFFQQMSSAVASDHDGDQGDCVQDCRMTCVGPTASGCCAAAILTAGCNALDRASIVACGISDTGFLGTGIDPDAFLRPPRSQV